MPRKKYARKLRIQSRGMLPAIFGVVLALCVIHRINATLRPLMIQSATTQVKNQVITAISLAVEELPLSYSDIITLEKDAQGRITALQSDMSAVGNYRDHLSKILITRLSGLKKQDISLPLGSLTGIDLLSGRGPGVPIKILSARAVSTSFENVFSAAGINQTRHQIMLNVTVTATILMPGKTTEVPIDHQLCVAETVIVGEVPEQYFYFEQGQSKPDSK